MATPALVLLWSSYTGFLTVSIHTCSPTTWSLCVYSSSKLLSPFPLDHLLRSPFQLQYQHRLLREAFAIPLPASVCVSFSKRELRVYPCLEGHHTQHHCLCLSLPCCICDVFAGRGLQLSLTPCATCPLSPLTKLHPCHSKWSYPKCLIRDQPLIAGTSIVHLCLLLLFMI